MKRNNVEKNNFFLFPIFRNQKDQKKLCVFKKKSSNKGLVEKRWEGLKKKPQSPKSQIFLFIQNQVLVMTFFSTNRSNAMFLCSNPSDRKICYMWPIFLFVCFFKMDFGKFFFRKESLEQYFLVRYHITPRVCWNNNIICILDISQSNFCWTSSILLCTT